MALPREAMRFDLHTAFRRLLRAALTLLFAGAVVAAGTILLLQIPAVARFTAHRVLVAINPFEGTAVSLAGTRGSWLSSLELTGLRVMRPDGTALFRIDTLRASYSLFSIIAGEYVFDDVTLVRPMVHAVQRPDSAWDLLAPFAAGPDTARPSEPPADGDGPRVLIRNVRIAGMAGVLQWYPPQDSLRRLTVQDLDLVVPLIDIYRGFAIRADSLRLRYAAPGLPGVWAFLEAGGAVDDSAVSVTRLTLRSPSSLVRARGRLPLTGRMGDGGASDFELAARPLAYRDLHPFLGAVGSTGDVDLEAHIRGPRAPYLIDARARFSQGGSAVIAGRTSGWGWKDFRDSLSVAVRALDLRTVTGLPRGTDDLNADALVEAAGPSPGDFSGRAVVSVQPSRIAGIRVGPSQVRARHTGGITEFDAAVSAAGVAATVAGSGRLLDSVPSVGARGTLSLPGPLPEGLAVVEDLAGGLTGRFTLTALGWSPPGAAGEVAVSLAAPEASDALLRTVRLAAMVTGAEGTFRIAATTDEGAAGARVRVVLRDSTITATLDSAAFEGIMPGDLLALDSVVVLSGEARATAVVQGGGVRSAQGHVSLSQSAYGSLEVRAAEIDLRLEDATTVLAVSASTSAGDLAAQGTVTSRPGFFAGTIGRLHAEAIDLAAVPGGGSVPTDLNIDARASFRCQSPDDLARLFTREGPRGAASTRFALAGTAGPSRWRDQQVTDGAFEAAFEGGRWDAAASFRLEGGSAAMRGSAEPYADSARWSVSEARMEGVDLEKLLGPEYPATSLSLDVTASAGGRTTETSSGNGRITIHPTQVNGGRIERGDIAVALAAGSFTAAADLRTAAGHIVLEASGGPAGESVPVTVDARVSLPDAGLFLGLDSSAASVFLDGRVLGTLRHGLPLDGEADLHGRGHLRGLRVDTVEFLATARDGLAEVHTLRIQGGTLSLSGAGSFAFATPDSGIAVSDFRLTGSLGDARPLLEAAGVADASVRNIAFDARVTGPAEVPILRTSLAAGRGFSGGIDFVGLQADGELVLRRWSALSSFAGNLAVEEAASGALKLTGVDGSVSGDGAHVRFDLHTKTGAGAWVAVSGDAAYGADTAAVRLDTLLIVRGASSVALQKPARILVGKRITVEEFDFRGQGGAITAAGTIDPQGTSSFTCRLDSVPLSALLLATDLRRIGGTVGGTLTLEGPAGSLRASGRLQATVTDSTRPLGTATAELLTGPHGFRLTTAITDTARNTLALDALLPARLSIAPEDSVLFVPFEGEAAITLTAQDFDIGILTPFLPAGTGLALAGRLDADAALTGARSAPALAGFFRGRDGSLELPAYGVRYSGITFDLGLEGNRLNLRDARARTGDGVLTAGGAVTLATLTQPSFDVTVRASAFELFRTPQITAVVDAELTVAGTPASPVLGGTVGLLEASYQLPESFGGNVSEVQLTDDDWLTLEERFGQRRPANGERDSTASDLYTRSSLDLGVTMARNVWLKNRKNPRMELGLEGTLRLRKPAGGPLQATGTLTPIAGRSYVEELGRRFKITGGDIRLEGDPADAAMRIVAAYDIPAQDRSSSSAIRIGLTVTMVDRKLDLAFSSDPAMEESEIITYLVTGKPSNAALAQAGDMGSLGASFALGQVVGSAESITEGKVPLDVFQIQQDGARGVTIVAGTYVSPETYLGIRQPIALTEDTRSTTTSPNVLEFELEQQVERWLLFNLQGGVDKLLAFFRFRHTY